jgi:HEPN domain-containing protein
MVLLADLEKLAQEHLNDAAALLAAGRYDGGVHLCGYAVEIALKARICNTLGWKKFPDSGHEYRSFLIHDLDVLLHLSGRENHIRTTLLGEWSNVASWRPEVRYKPVGHASAPDLTQMIESAKKLLAELL